MRSANERVRETADIQNQDIPQSLRKIPKFPMWISKSSKQDHRHPTQKFPHRNPNILFRKKNLPKLFEINRLCKISLTFLCHFYSGQRLNQYKEDDFYILVLLIDSFSLFLCIHAVWKLSRNKNLNRKSSLLYWYTTTTVNTYKKIKLRISWKIKKEFHDHLNLK